MVLGALQFRWTARRSPRSSCLQSMRVLRHLADTQIAVSTIRVGPGGIPSRDDPAAAIATLIERGYDACEIDFSDGFWMDRDYAQRLGSLARDAALALSIHAPLAAFLGHVQHGGREHQMAGGMLRHTAGLAAACGAAPGVLPPRLLLRRSREGAPTAGVGPPTGFRQRPAGQGRAGAFRGGGI